jgi:hypothetical protein
MGKKVNATTISPLESLARCLLTAMERTQATHEPVTTFKLEGRDTEFQVTLKRIDGRRVLSKPEALLMARVKDGHQDLAPAEIRVARRILAKQR